MNSRKLFCNKRGSRNIISSGCSPSEILLFQRKLIRSKIFADLYFKHSYSVQTLFDFFFFVKKKLKNSWRSLVCVCWTQSLRVLYSENKWLPSIKLAPCIFTLFFSPELVRKFLFLSINRISKVNRKFPFPCRSTFSSTPDMTESIPLHLSSLCCKKSKRFYWLYNSETISKLKLWMNVRCFSVKFTLRSFCCIDGFIKSFKFRFNMNEVKFEFDDGHIKFKLVCDKTSSVTFFDI